MHLTKGNDKLHFYYDAQARPQTVKFNGEYYDYVQNLQGDIVRIVDKTGAGVVEYTYDAWGKPTSKTGSLAGTLGAVNPFRYRGYVWDEETGLSMCTNRYYNPEWGRFINADTLLGKTGKILSHNIFSYCKNNPIVFSDPSGKTEKRAWYAGIVQWAANLFPSVSKKFNSPNYGRDEKTLALNHLLAAINGDVYNRMAGEMTDRIFGSGATNMDGTLANAFKHAYWNALMSHDFGSGLAERFANAHEEPYRSQWDEEYLGTTIGTHTEMDYYYNALGRSIGQQRFPDNMATNHLIAQAVLSAISADTSRVLIWDYGFTIADDIGTGLR
jgi:RHS repeat-associated protein